jgi:DnaK suppressor protein
MVLKSNQIKELKKILISKRDDLLKIVTRKKYRDLPDTETGDEIDNALQSVEKEILFELTNNEKVTLDNIEAALRKIEKKKYGICELCHKKIAYRRLKVMPWARYCIKCQNKAEK